MVRLVDSRVPVTGPKRMSTVETGPDPESATSVLTSLRRRICAGAAALLVALSATSLAFGASERYDPRLRFRTISTPRFDIHFHQGEEAIAKRLAVVAEQVATEMEPRLGRPRMRVNVILVDQTDLSNGWATPVPYNLIEIAAAAPRADSIIGNTRDWLRLVFTHEYTHVLHLERSRGWLGAIGRPFGRLPCSIPTCFCRRCSIEGIATHEEGATTGEGRPPAGDFRMLIDRAARGRAIPVAGACEQRASSHWPSGHTPLSVRRAISTIPREGLRTSNRSNASRTRPQRSRRISDPSPFARSTETRWAISGTTSCAVTRRSDGDGLEADAADTPRIQRQRPVAFARRTAVLSGGQPARLSRR